jgi:chemotaxis protein CheY-P-specific phosphatase CheC
MAEQHYSKQGGLKLVLRRVLEKQAFLFAEAVEKDDLSAPEGDLVEGRIAFRGDATGTLVVIVPAAMCPLIAANVLGIEAEDAQAAEQGLDAFKEVLNVLCGHIVTDLLGKDKACDLTPPEATACSVERWIEFLNDPSVETFVIDEQPMLVRLEIAGA